MDMFSASLGFVCGILLAACVMLPYLFRTLQKNALLVAEKKVLLDQLHTQKEFFESSKKTSLVEFEHLAQRIFGNQSAQFSEQTEKTLESVLKPLKEKMGDFEKKVESAYSIESRERFALKAEMGRLIGLNEKMTQETQSLTQALKGDSKTQGDWGELVLERILEAAGLRAGHEYIQQETYQDGSGDRFRPDIIIQLPDQKHVIIDAKVSLLSYELHQRTEDPTLKAQSLKAHLKSIETHVKTLGDKHYSKLDGIHSPEFVFLFIPIEPAYLLAMQADSDLAIRAWRRGVAIVTATPLLASLKTVASIWSLEKQNKNALEIALEGARLYDKFVGFLEDFEKIGKIFESGQNCYGQALNKLKDGPGNIFRKMELLRELGAAPQKRIHTEWLDRSL